jgi:hypothetical protein
MRHLVTSYPLDSKDSYLYKSSSTDLIVLLRSSLIIDISSSLTSVVRGKISTAVSDHPSSVRFHSFDSFRRLFQLIPGHKRDTIQFSVY